MAAFNATPLQSYIPVGYAYVLIPILGAGCCKYDGIGIRFATRDFAIGYAMTLGMHSFKIIKEFPENSLHRSVWRPNLYEWVQGTIPPRQRANSI